MLNWKRKTFHDTIVKEEEDMCWHSAKVKALRWEFVVDNTESINKYDCYLFPTNSSDDVKINKRAFKTAQAAKNFCNRYLLRTIAAVQKGF